MADALPHHIENPVTGDRIEFLNSPLHGDLGPLIFRTALAPAASGSPLHRHATFEEVFRVEQGVLDMEIGGPGHWRSLAAGEAVRVPAGVAHSFRNALDSETVFVTTVSEGRGFEKFLRSLYGLAAAGRSDRNGMPKNPLALALVLSYADLLLPSAPRWLQAGIVGGLAAAARRFGVEAELARTFGWAAR